MRPTIYSVVVVIFIIGLLANESTSQQKLPTIPPPPPINYSPFNIHPDGSLSRKVERVMYLLYPSIRQSIVTHDTHMWLKSLPPALIEAHSLSFKKLHDIVHTFSQIVTFDDLPSIITAVGRMNPRFEMIGIISASVNRILAVINALSGDDRQKRMEQLVYECLFRAGYVLKGREGWPDFKLSTQEAWVIIMSWMIQFPEGTD